MDAITGPNGLTITEINVTIYSGDKRLKAFVGIKLNDALYLHDCRIIESRGQLILSMPSRERTVPCERCKLGIGIGDLWCRKCGLERDRTYPCKACGVRNNYTLRTCVCGNPLPDRWLDTIHPLDHAGRAWLSEAAVAAYVQAIASEAA